MFSFILSSLPWEYRREGRIWE